MSKLQGEELAKLRAEYLDWLGRVDAGNHKTLSYNAPCCNGVIRAVPTVKPWANSGLCRCPHCGDMHVQLVTHDKAEGKIPNEAAA